MERRLLPTSDYPPKRGGVARMLSTMVAHVPGLRPVVVSPTATYRELLKAFWHHRASFDSIFVSHVLPIGTAAMIYRWMTGTRYDVLLHGMDFDLARSEPRKRLLLKCVLRCARRVFANSSALSKEVSAFAKRTVEVLHPSISDELIEVSSMIGDRQGSGTKILTVARLVDRKGHVKVLEAMRKIPELTYTIVGDGPMRKEIETKVKEYGLFDRVTLLQHVSDGKLPELYASHDIFVMPTSRSRTDREGFGIVYLEAGLFGLPVIATRQPGVDEAVIEDETGLLIEDSINDLIIALEHLRTDASLRKRLGDAGRLRVLRLFTPDVTYRTLGAVADRLVQERPLISVVIPTYQHANAVGNCIRSIQEQTYAPIEIIVVNDGSTDDTKGVLDTFGKSITVIHQENQGGNAARNRGLAEARGEFVLFADADVVMKPGMIDRFYDVLCAHPEASYAYSGFTFGWKKFHGVPFSGEALRRSNFVMTTSLVRTADFPGFDPALRRFQDWDVWLTMLARGKTGVLVPGTWFSVVIDGESRTGSSWLPAFVYQLPWPIFGYTPERIKKYQAARSIIEKKHGLC